MLNYLYLEMVTKSTVAHLNKICFLIRHTWAHEYRYRSFLEKIQILFENPFRKTLHDSKKKKELIISTK